MASSAPMTTLTRNDAKSVIHGAGIFDHKKILTQIDELQRKRVTIFVWPRKGTNIGHTSLLLGETFYVSFWPNNVFNSLEDDIKAEDNQLPEFFSLFQFDAEAMSKAYLEASKIGFTYVFTAGIEKVENPIAKTLIGRSPNNKVIAGLNLESNCCTLIRDLLLVGGLKNYPKELQDLSMVMPDNFLEVTKKLVLHEIKAEVPQLPRSNIQDMREKLSKIYGTHNISNEKMKKSVCVVS